MVRFKFFFFGFTNRTWDTCHTSTSGNADPKLGCGNLSCIFTLMSEHRMYDLIMLLVVVAFGYSCLGMNKLSRYHKNTGNKAVFSLDLEVEWETPFVFLDFNQFAVTAEGCLATQCFRDTKQVRTQGWNIRNILDWNFRLGSVLLDNITRPCSDLGAWDWFPIANFDYGLGFFLTSTCRSTS